jgi:hypothetical protein
MFDNKIFNINGKGKEMLDVTLQLAIYQDWGPLRGALRGMQFTGWRFDPEAGLVLTTYDTPGKDYNVFVTPLSTEQTAEFVINQITRPEYKDIPLGQWEDDADHDGHNSRGWRAYMGDWGQIGGDWRSLIAIKPVYLWHGK